MKPARFSYAAPTTVDEAVAVLGQEGADAKILAGGQSLVPMMSLRLTTIGTLVDINKVAGLDTISLVDGSLRVGALVRQAVAERDGTVASASPLLSRALPHIGHFQIRNRGTVGGSIAHADPASELPAVALALGAKIEIAGPSGIRHEDAADFFESTWTTTLAADELLAAVHFPVWTGKSGFAVEEMTRRHGDFALVGATVGVTLDGDAVTRAAITLFGVASTPVRAHGAEAALIAAGAGGDLAAVGKEAANMLNPTDDIHATGAYRKHVAAVMVRRALESAIKEAQA